MTKPMLNAIAKIEEQFLLKPDALALWMHSSGVITYRMPFIAQRHYKIVENAASLLLC